MQFFPDSATLSETGAAPAAPAAGGGAAGAAAAAGMGGGAAGIAGAVGVGEIVLNRAESAALAALETEEDEATGHRRARDESGLSKEQVDKLKSRADAALKKGFTLKGQGFTKKPQAAAPDEPGLTREKVKKDPAAGAKTKEAGAISSILTRQDRHEFYTLPPELDYGMPAPQSGGFGDTDDDAVKETNTRSTMSAMMMKKAKAKKSC